MDIKETDLMEQRGDRTKDAEAPQMARRAKALSDDIIKFTIVERRIAFVLGMLNGAAMALCPSLISTILFSAVGILALIRAQQLK